MTDGVSNEPVIAPTPAPISVEPRVAAPVEPAAVAKDEPVAKVAPVKDEPAKPLSTREALRAAAAKVEAVAEKAKPLSVDPAAAPVTKEPVAKDAKTAPVVSKDAEPAAPTRAADGKFVSTKPAEPVVAVKADVPDPAAKVEPVAKPALPSHTASPPPARFSQAAKDRWAETPDDVRAETERAVTELTKGFEKHRAAAERDSSVAEFHEMATKQGTTLKDALSRYTNMENVLRADPIKGLELIAKNAGLSLRDVATKILNQAPDQVASAADARVIALETELADLKKGVGTLTQEREQAKTDSTTEAVTKFAAGHPRFEELSEDIAFFLKTRTKDLAEAYKLAERLNPAPAAPATAEVTPAPVASSVTPPIIAKPTLVPDQAAQTRGQKSIAGTPTAGSDPVRKQPSNSIKEAIRRAAAAAG